eukprot:Plantae.Rhodophyta-Hildenbrandia_rubra.ctg18795.p1 GENE.Plantae.Rhodophyta-Hildenbrandia_rubra.ctg18795~~Plantae.Rhodophyta-Hildenbrandia_rubra.ctg18795.p1  ORF type:complete len:123 (+),score=2.01 Plantae.Rhodophyta-Hildenbrandia_rubra.ctg18795:651-1019(+)
MTSPDLIPYVSCDPFFTGLFWIAVEMIRNNSEDEADCSLCSACSSRKLAIRLLRLLCLVSGLRNDNFTFMSITKLQSNAAKLHHNMSFRPCGIMRRAKQLDNCRSLKRPAQRSPANFELLHA